MGLDTEGANASTDSIGYARATWPPGIRRSEVVGNGEDNVLLGGWLVLYAYLYAVRNTARHGLEGRTHILAHSPN